MKLDEIGIYQTCHISTLWHNMAQHDPMTQWQLVCLAVDATVDATLFLGHAQVATVFRRWLSMSKDLCQNSEAP